jgi:hypothetical protein
MSRRLRLILVLVGLALAFCSLVALTYAFWPVEIANLQATIEPTLFVAP